MIVMSQDGLPGWDGFGFFGNCLVNIRKNFADLTKNFCVFYAKTPGRRLAEGPILASLGAKGAGVVEAGWARTEAPRE